MILLFLNSHILVLSELEILILIAVALSLGQKRGTTLSSTVQQYLLNSNNSSLIEWDVTRSRFPLQNEFSNFNEVRLDKIL